MSTHRIGMLVPSSNLTMETELPRMMNARSKVQPEDAFTFHTSRMRMKSVTPEELKAMNAQTSRATSELADANLDVVATACLVAIMAQGPKYHLEAEQEIRETLQEHGQQLPVVSSAGALIKGARALGASRIAIMTPYMKPLTKLVADYIEDFGIEVVDALSFEVADNLEVARLDPADLEHKWKQLNTANADAIVVSACVQMPSLSAVSKVEAASGLPAFSASTATAYEILTSLGVSTAIPGFGHLLSHEHAQQKAAQSPDPATLAC